MQKKRFNKKSILGILKTYHAKKRQKQRDISDSQLTHILQNGELQSRSDYEVNITLDGYSIYLSHDQERIITLIAPDKQEINPKLISRNEGKKLKKEIETTFNKGLEGEQKELSFDEYMKSLRQIKS